MQASILTNPVSSGLQNFASNFSGVADHQKSLFARKQASESSPKTPVPRVSGISTVNDDQQALNPQPTPMAEI